MNVSFRFSIFVSRLALLIGYIQIFIALAQQSSTKNYSINLEKNLNRVKRQFDHVAPNSPQIDLNITVPYIFSARLYPYGKDNEDSVSITEDSPQIINLKNTLTFLEKTYDVIYIHHDGVVSLSSEFMPKNVQSLPIPTHPIIPVFWQKSRAGKVFYRESMGIFFIYRALIQLIDPNIINLAQSEVNIQYRYGNDFQTTSVIIVTWEELMREKEEKEGKKGNVFQIALILGENACFAHIVYSKLQFSNNAIAGFNGGNDVYFSLPGSGTPNAIQLIEKSNIGIPGEWLFRIDEERIYLCGAGFQGIECVDSCAPSQWYLDCSRQCHCADGNSCNVDTGECPESKCNPGWEGAPTCDQGTKIKFIHLSYQILMSVLKIMLNVQVNNQIVLIHPAHIFVYVLNMILQQTAVKDRLEVLKKFKYKAYVGNKSEQIPVSIMPLIPLLPSTTTKIPHKQNLKEKSTFGATILSPEDITGSVVSDGIQKIPLASFFDTPTSTPENLIQAPLTITIRPMLGQSFKKSTKMPIKLTSTRPIGRDSTTPESNCHKCHQMARCLADGRCECVPGWVGNGFHCEDANECATQNACGQNAECQNTVGSYQCVCNVGFVAASNGYVDECAESMVQCRGGNTSICVNTMGGYECKCRSGFTGHPDSPQGCVEKATCHNTPGSYICNCFEGFEKQVMATTQPSLLATNMVPPLTRCVDMNECQHNPCHSAANCTNLEGTFKCDCNPGFIGNGIECHETILFPISKNAITLVPALTPHSVPLDIPLISTNGLIGFDKSLDFVENPQELKSVSLLPLHLKYNPETSGSIKMQIVAGNNADDHALLTKATMSIQDKFHDNEFRATSLYIITYDRMHELNVEKINTFQVIIAQNLNATYVIYLYENIETSLRGIAGISYSNGFMPLPIEILHSNSNVGQGGKWIFRIDGIQGPIHCPAGTIGAPLCQQDCTAGSWGFNCAQQCKCADQVPCDFRSGFCSNGKCEPGFHTSNYIDECMENTHKCDSKATCQNTYGSYSCKCKTLFVGNGFHCEPVDPCLIRFGATCAFNAHCDSTNVDVPECVCNENFHGDGRRKITETTTTKLQAITRKQQTTTPPKIDKEVSTSSEQNTPPFTFSGNNELNGIFDHSDNKINTKKPELKRPITKQNKTSFDTNKVDEDYNIFSTNKIVEEASMITLVVSSILFGIWVILVIAFGIFYCCRKRRSRIDKYSPQMMGWSPRDYSSTGNNSSYFSQLNYT